MNSASARIKTIDSIRERSLLPSSRREFFYDIPKGSGIYIDMRVRKSAILILLLLSVLLIDPSRYFASVKNGILLFTASVLPSMLPYFFFTKLFTAVGGAEGIARSVGKPVAKAYGVAPICGYALVMSLLSGYPVGARVLGDLYDKGLVGEEDVRRASSFASTSGSMFVLGSVGSAILGNVKAGWVILISHYLGALLNGFLHCVKKRKNAEKPLPPLLILKSDTLLSDAMYESGLSLALVGGFIALTNLSADIFTDLIGLFGTDVLARSNVVSGLVYSFFEVTRGCVVFSECALPPCMTAALAAAAISFGGLSVILQTLAFLGKAGVKSGRLLLMKGTQSIITFGLCLGLGAVFL